MKGASDRDARVQAIASTESVLVQAPAGSGKTTLLTQRYLRLLATVSAPEQILALTFTRRAAQEMRERVLNALSLGYLEQCPADFNEETWHLAQAARRHLDHLNLDIESQPSRLRIETIDAFNAWLASQLPITAGAGAGLQVQSDAKPSYEEAARRALAHEEAGSFGAAVEKVLILDDQRWRRLVHLIADLLPSRDRWLPLLAGRLQAARALDENELQRMRRHFDEDLQMLVARVLVRAYDIIGAEKIDALSPLLHAAAKRLGEQGGASEWLRDGRPLRALTAELERWRAMAKCLLTADGTIRRAVNKNDGFPPQCADKPAMLDLLAELERDPGARRILNEIRSLPTPLYSDEQWSRVRDVAQVLVLAAAELDQVFREQGAVDFPAISLAALRALGSASSPTDLALRLDYRLKHLLVDEFQDTSSAQLELVRLLTAGWELDDGRSVFCVGDPMQSIYGFRQAEVRAFLELAEDGIGDVRFQVQRLQSNFRSVPRLVNWINRTFARIMPRVDDRDRGAIAFRASTAAVVDAADAVDAADSINEAARAVTLRGFATRAEEAEAVADTIALEIREHPKRRIAVLVRARTHAREVAVNLRLRGVVFRAVDIEPLRDRAVVRDVIALLRALLHAGDRIAWLAVLRAPWVGLSLGDLLTLTRGAEAGNGLIGDALMQESITAQLSDEGRRRCERLSRVLTASFAVRNDTTLARWIERVWLALGGASCVSGASDLELAATAFARLRDLEERGMPDAAGLAESFDDLYADQGSDSLVEIMTIHKAKGLEFDTVVVPALDRYVPSDRDQLLLTYQFARTGRDGMVMAARAPVGGDSDRLFEFLRHQLRDAASLEAQRLLYVACTRAKHRLMLTATVGRTEPEASDEESARGAWSPRTGSLLAVLWPMAAADFALQAPPAASSDGAFTARGAANVDFALRETAAALADGSARSWSERSIEGGPIEEGAPRGGPLSRVPSGWSPHVDPHSMGESLALSALSREGTPVFDWAGETARRVGSLVHAELQTMDLAAIDASIIQARRPHFHRWLSLRGVPEERLVDAAGRVVDALLAVHKDPRGQWILKRGYRDDFREHALSGHWQGEVVRVVFDRSFVDEKGVRWVIDYKTSQHSGGALDEFLDREVERYRAQLQRYAGFARRLGPEPVRVGLYFPLMRGWRDWEP